VKTNVAISIILLALAIGGAGGYFGAYKTEASRSLPDLELLAGPDTFSRVKNTKSMLDAMSRRAKISIMEAVVAYWQLPKTTDTEKRIAQENLGRIIRAAESTMQEFDGTEQQAVVAQALLLALQEAKLYDRWTEVYLRTLYEHPTCPVILTSAANAISFSDSVGQQARVLAALRWLNGHPLDTMGKALIQEVLKSASPRLAKTDDFRNPLAMTTADDIKAISLRN